MKTRFAKIVDGTLGAALLFFASTALYLYFMPIRLATFSALATTAAAYLMLDFVQKKRGGKLKIQKAAQDMYFDFMFESDRTPVKLLASGLERRGETAAIHGAGLFCNNVAAYCIFDRPPSALDVARGVSRAKHYGARKLVIFSKLPPEPDAKLDIDGISVKHVVGDDVYKLFASLDALPQPKYSKKAGRRFAGFHGALGKDRIVKYAVLTASLVFAAVMLKRSPVIIACAAVSALLFIAAVVYNIAISVKKQP